MRSIDIQALRNAAEAADNVTAQFSDADGVTTVTYEMKSNDETDAEAFASILVEAAGREPDEAGAADPGFYMIWK